MIVGTILAGGEGKRIGGAKPDRLLAGRPLAQWALDSLQKSVSRVVVSIAPGQELPRLTARVPLDVCEDVLPGRGPLTGIYTALRCSEANVVLAVPCDAPFVEPALLRMLLDARHGWDAVVPEVGGKPQVQLGVYTSAVTPTLVAALNSDELAVRRFLARVRVHMLPEARVREADPELRSFFNINTVADLGRAESMVAALAAC